MRAGDAGGLDHRSREGEGIRSQIIDHESSYLETKMRMKMADLREQGHEGGGGGLDQSESSYSEMKMRMGGATCPSRGTDLERRPGIRSDN